MAQMLKSLNQGQRRKVRSLKMQQCMLKLLLWYLKMKIGGWNYYFGTWKCCSNWKCNDSSCKWCCDGYKCNVTCWILHMDGWNFKYGRYSPIWGWKYKEVNNYKTCRWNDSCIVHLTYFVSPVSATWWKKAHMDHRPRLKFHQKGRKWHQRNWLRR